MSDTTYAKVFAEIQKLYGDGSIMWLSSADRLDVQTIPTGSLALDIATGVGGYPRGRIIEIYGPESSGKTTLTLHAIAEAQKLGLACGFIDMENAFDPEYASKLGINVDQVAITQPDTGEQALTTAEILLRSGLFGVVVVDSVAALVPEKEIEGDMGDAQMGAQARLMSQALRKITGAVRASNALLIFTNQLRMKIGVMYGEGLNAIC